MESPGSVEAVGAGTADDKHQEQKEEQKEEQKQQEQQPIVTSMNDLSLSSPIISSSLSVPAIDPSSSSSYVINKMENILYDTLSDIQVRSEVEQCMNSLLIDVELTYNLKQELQLKSYENQVEQLQLQQEAMIQDTKATMLHREQQRLDLADHLIQDLWKFNIQLENLIKWKKEHEYKISNYDEMMAKLVQAEEELQLAQRVSYGGDMPEKQSTYVAATTTATATTSTGGGSAPASTTTTTTTTGGSNNLKSPPPSSSTTTVLQSNVETEEKHEDKKQGAADSDIDKGKKQSGDEDTQQKQPDTEKGTATVVDIPPPKQEVATTVADIPPPSKPQPTDAEMPSDGVAGDKAISGDDTSNKTSQEVEASSTTEADAAAAAVAARTASAVVSLDDDEPEEEVPGLVEVDVEILLRIFGFLEAMDILNTAQINLPMYTRVDAIFGVAGDGIEPPKPTPRKKPSQKGRKPSSSHQQRQAQASQSTTRTTSPVPTPTVAVPPPQMNDTKPPAVASMPAPAPAPAPAASGGMGLFSILQPRAPVAGGKRGGQGQPLTASVAQSMAEKLSDAELAAIISMTDKLSKMEKEVNILRNQKEEADGKLQGVENVKKFLIEKVRAVESKLKQSQEDEIKVTQQIASDQEVIAFLDGRTQELERDISILTKEKVSAENELSKLKVSSSKKVTMLSDMLKYEKEKLREEEAEWKATKKVLVKEVKSCRSHIVALQAERDGYKEQNEMLKRAIVEQNNGKSPRKRK